MARIAGVNIPTNKRVIIALQYIHGVGAKKAEEICTKVNIPAEPREAPLRRSRQRAAPRRQPCDEASHHLPGRGIRAERHPILGQLLDGTDVRSTAGPGGEHQQPLLVHRSAHEPY